MLFMGNGVIAISVVEKEHPSDRASSSRIGPTSSKQPETWMILIPVAMNTTSIRLSWSGTEAPGRAPRVNAHAERFVRTFRTEFLDGDRAPRARSMPPSSRTRTSTANGRAPLEARMGCRRPTGTSVAQVLEPRFELSVPGRVGGAGPPGVVSRWE